MCRQAQHIIEVVDEYMLDGLIPLQQHLCNKKQVMANTKSRFDRKEEEDSKEKEDNVQVVYSILDMSNGHSTGRQ